MATYEEIYGKRVDVLDDDPTLTSANEGQVWYNSTTGTLKTLISFGAFFSSSNMGTARYGHGATGEVSSIIANGGTTGSGTNVSEEFNGSGWASSNNMNTTRFYISDFGNSQTAAVAVNGRSPGETFMNDVEEYNGTSWTTATDTPYNSNNTNTFGVLTAGVSAGGNNTSAPATTTVAEYDGTNWTAATALPTSMRESITGGTQTAGFVASGGPGPSDNVNHFQYDGTNWTVAGNVNTQRQSAASGGTQTYAIGASGYDNPLQYLTSSAIWDGSTWAAGATVAVGRYASGKGSTSTGTGDIFCGGQTKSGPSYPNPAGTEEYAFSFNTTTAAAWAASNNMNTGSYNPSPLVGGTQTAVLAAGGDTGGPAYATTKSELYDGTSWTAKPTLNTARSAGTSTGTSTACIVFGAYPPSNAPATESWNGSSWTTTPATLGAPIERSGGAGTQTAALAFAYYNRPGNSNPTTVYTYNGSSWTTSPASMNSGRYATSGLGTQTAALAIGGVVVTPPAQSAAVEQWNGSSWTSKTSLISARGYGGASGTSTSAIFFGGNPPSPSTATEGWDGTSWSTRPSLGTARGGVGGSGTSADAGVAYGGGSYLANTEEFTGATETATAKTLTTG